MKLPALLASDLHLVGAQSADYRWGLFPWLADRINEHGVRTLGLLGDLTDAKDNHAAALVNRTVRELRGVQKKAPTLKDIIALAGNHDWLLQGHEFFAFLNEIPGIRFITSPTEVGVRSDKGEAVTLWLPYTKNPAKDWKGMDFQHYEYGFIHQTVKGSVSSNGQLMDGEELPNLDDFGKVYSGDIHVPQVVHSNLGRIEYVGSPYHVHFGDNFRPRCVLIGQDRKARDLHFETIRRVTLRVKTLRELERLASDLSPGDQLKVRLELDASERHAWSRLRREAHDMLTGGGIDIHGIELVAAHEPLRLRAAARSASPVDALVDFVEREGLGGSVLDAGLDLMED